MGAEYRDVEVSVRLSVREHISRTAGPTLTKFLRMLPMAVARSSSGDVAICYILPVLWMTSHLHIIGRMIEARRSIPLRRVMSSRRRAQAIAPLLRRIGCVVS